MVQQQSTSAVDESLHSTITRLVQSRYCCLQLHSKFSLVLASWSLNLTKLLVTSACWIKILGHKKVVMVIARTCYYARTWISVSSGQRKAYTGSQRSAESA